MPANYGKEQFGAFLNSYGQTPVTDTCHNYGSMSGCDFECPALLRGDCRSPDWIKSDNGTPDDIDEEDYKEILELYYPQQ